MDYSKLTVAKLKEELTARDISFAGLKLKAQFIERLEQADNEAGDEAGGDDASGELESKPTDVANEIEDDPSAMDVRSADEPAVAPQDTKRKRSSSDLGGTQEEGAAKKRKQDDSDVAITQKVADFDGNAAIVQADQIVPAGDEAGKHTDKVDAAAIFHQNASEELDPLHAEEQAKVGAEQAKQEEIHNTIPTPTEQVSVQAETAEPPLARLEDGTQIQEAPSPAAEQSTTRSDLSHPSNQALTRHDSSTDFFDTSSTHPPTSAIYIKNLKRPLQIPSFKSHIINLAVDGDDDAEDPIKSFFLDTIRTHCFVTLSSVHQAVKVRAAMHEHIWPAQETSREPMWVDFVPEAKVEEWIQTESDTSAGRSSMKRWEVEYKNAPDGGVDAVLRESLPFDAQPDAARASGQASARTQATARPPPPPQSSGFLALDERFKFTTAKPKIYYLPVTDDLARARRTQLRDRTDPARSRDAPAQGAPDGRRFTFDEEQRDRLVDNGPEFGLRHDRPGMAPGSSHRRDRDGLARGPRDMGYGRGPPRDDGFRRGGRGGGGYRRGGHDRSFPRGILDRERD